VQTATGEDMTSPQRMIPPSTLARYAVGDDPPAAVGECHRLELGVHVELLEDVVDMVAHGSEAEIELLRDRSSGARRLSAVGAMVCATSPGRE
jgi:hypothetical protein